MREPRRTGFANFTVVLHVIPHAWGDEAGPRGRPPTVSQPPTSRLRHRVRACPRRGRNVTGTRIDPGAPPPAPARLPWNAGPEPGCRPLHEIPLAGGGRERQPAPLSPAP